MNKAVDAGPARRRYGKVKWIAGGFIALCIAGAAGVGANGSAPVSPAVPLASLVPATVTVSPSAASPTTQAPVPVVHYMPDVVGMNLQAAQDKIQEAGVFYSRSEDATGQARHQILDRDWTVVAQNIPAGRPFGEGDAVLSVVKIGE